MIPLYVGRLGGGLAEAGLAVAVFNAAAAIASLVFGRLSSLKVLRSYVLGGFLGFTLASMLFYFASSVVHVFLASASAGFATAVCALAAALLIAETRDGSSWGKEMGAFNRISDFGWLSGLVIGALWSYLSKGKELCIVSAALTGISFTYAFTILKWQPAGCAGMKQNDAGVRGEGRGRSNGLTVLYVASTFLMFLSTSLAYSLLPSFIVRIGGVDMEVFLVYVSSTTISVLTYPRVESISKGDHVHVQSLASAGRALITATLALTALLLRGTTGILLVAATMLLSGFTWAILNVAGPAAAMKLHEKKGKIMGIYNASIFLSSIAGSALSGIIAENLGYPTLFLTAAMLTSASIPLLEKVRQKSKTITHVATDKDHIITTTLIKHKHTYH